MYWIESPPPVGEGEIKGFGDGLLYTIAKLRSMITIFWAAAPKGPMTYTFTKGKIFFSSVNPPPLNPGLDEVQLRLEAQIPISRLKSQSRGLNLSQGLNPSFKA